MAWFTHWETSFDLARGGVELSFRSPEDMMHLLVETDPIRSVNNIIKNIESNFISSRYHIIGTRGFGKSTLLNYVAFSLYNNVISKRVLPVHGTLLGTATDEKELEFIFFRSLLESLFDIPRDMKRFYPDELFPDVIKQLTDAEETYKRKLEEFGQLNLEFVYTAFENQLEHLKPCFRKISFLVDGLDKQDTSIVLKFLRNTQERLNNIINKYNCIFMDAADPSWRETLDTKEFSGVRGRNINLRGWMVDEVEALIKKRLNRIGIFTMPFNRKALDILVEDFQGNSREILQYATTLLHYAAKERIKTIGSGIARKIVWSDDAKEKFFDKVISDPDMRYAFEKLKVWSTDRQIMNILIATYNQRNQRLSTNLPYDARSSIGITLTNNKYKKFLEILINKGCLKRSKIQDYVKLEDDLHKLLDYAVTLGQSVVAFPVILSELESKIRHVPFIPKEEIIMKDEIQKIFEQHTKEWLDYRKLKHLLFENPRTANRLRERFKEDTEKTVTITIPLIVNKLREDAHLMLDELTHAYRWRPSWINYETAEYFRSKDILDKIDSAEQELSKRNFPELTNYCQDILYGLISRMNELYGERVDTSNIHDIVAFFKMFDIDVQKPFSLELLLSSLENIPSNIDEATIMLRAIILYAKKIHRKINQLIQFESKNEKIINKIKDHHIGVTKESERHAFNSVFLPILLNNYGELVDCMTKIKMGEGFIETQPDILKPLLDKQFLLQAKLFECPICKIKTIISADNIETVNCQEDKVPLSLKKDGFVLSEEAYQIWNVWMEEYSKYLFQNLLCKYVESGINFKPIESIGVTTGEEVDVVVVYNGISIAVECIENISCLDEKNDPLNIIRKIEYLGLFDAIILIYKKIDNNQAFNSIVKKHKKILYPILIKNQYKLKDELNKTLKKIKSNIIQN